MALEVIKRRNLYEEIVSQIIRFIQEKNIKPGEKLPSENELVEIFQVSKTAVREALSVLVAKGIVEKRPGVGSILKELNGGTLIEPITSKLIMEKQVLRELLEFRRGLEIESAALAAERATNEQLEAIENAHLELIEVNRKGEIGIEEDFRFHYLILISSGNSIYENIFDSMSTKFMEALKITKNQSKKLSKLYLEEAHVEHERILNALKQRNPAEARLAMLDHLHKNEIKIWNNEL
ncbi:FadR/GntR family transcriptional regulator [Ectobacillus panaciterrae]|uniref:FadR/GntR family transcriptional regulator n=1 Tax=Ectobacillus panaciterrae TaxID=363872 RepID=UPI0004163E09|nr:FadR/GntR family transcriptional regulator [Ectobacillus panaciterrae]